MQHLEEGEIHAWLDGALSGDERARVERHVRECAECSVAVADARGMIAGAARIISALDAVPGGVIPKQTAAQRTPQPSSLWRSLRLTPVRAGLAASLMIAVASLFAVRHNSSDKIALPPRVEAAAPSPVATDAAPPPPTKAAEAKAPPAAVALPKPAAPHPAPVAVEGKDAKGVRDAKTVVAAVDSTKTKPAPLPPSAAAVADAQMTTGQLQVDSARAKLAAPAASASGATRRRPFAVMDRLQEVQTTGVSNSPPTFVGCYRIGSDSSNSLSPLPAHFSLAQTSDSTGDRNTVRAIAPNGRDSLVAGATWTAVRSTMVTVTWPGGDRERSLVIARTGDRITALRPDIGQRVPIDKVVCRP